MAWRQTVARTYLTGNINRMKCQVRLGSPDLQNELTDAAMLESLLGVLLITLVLLAIVVLVGRITLGP